MRKVDRCCSPSGGSVKTPSLRISSRQLPFGKHPPPLRVYGDARAVQPLVGRPGNRATLDGYNKLCVCVYICSYLISRALSLYPPPSHIILFFAFSSFPLEVEHFFFFFFFELKYLMSVASWNCFFS